MKKILVLRFSSLGDIVMATAMVRNLRRAHPHARIDMVVRADFLDLIRDNPHLDGKIGLPRGGGFRGLWHLLKQLNAENYDVIYDAHRSLRTRLLMPLLNAREKYYYDKQYVRRSLLLTFKIPFLRNAPRMLERYHEPLAAAGVSYDGRGPELFLSGERAKLDIPRSEGGGFVVGIIPSAQWPGKRWPLDRFRELLVRLVDKTSFSMIVFGGPEDTFCAELCRDLPPSRVVNAQGRLNLRESAVVLAECDFVIANDTGLMHMADALGKPSVLILGPTSSEMGCLPYHPASRVIEHELWCRPCSKNGQAPCIRSRRYCLDLTTTDAVFAAAKDIARALGEKSV